MANKVFISHSGKDKWVAKQIRNTLENKGITTFLDDRMAVGDDFEDVILQELKSSQEFIVLFTPWAVKSFYVWLEVGAAWCSGLRIIAVLHGITLKQFISITNNPILITRRHLIDINELDKCMEEVIERLSSSNKTIS